MVDEACYGFPSDEDIVTIDGEGDPILTYAKATLTRDVNIEPTVGLAFTDEDEAYDYYNNYAKLIGQGFRSEMYDGSENAHPNTKYGFYAKIRIKKDEKHRWVIVKFVKEYNRILTMPNKTRFIRYHRKIPNIVKKVIDT
ncbi:protein FAR1-RELATED SEQUENCE 7-like [Amborella trichopoda]|uniref:protein FAR1-RELATED SEQUENCE 7-like n=1 Tax=Amborella trichopoda TaxID=13333 RepID=UPI0009BC9729|nr:protein FAR1-RELATED SEQUENCE 7-like [Amborella trichopoda]|eukprot:XP_020519406.1 protein FAR1-RELATED SEQUENCE 7-like [Amborella trichopoda]